MRHADATLPLRRARFLDEIFFTLLSLRHAVIALFFALSPMIFLLPPPRRASFSPAADAYAIAARDTMMPLRL